MQCKKRLWLDYHKPIAEELTASRRAHAEVGQQLLALARSAFPKGIAITAEDPAKAAAETKRLLDDGMVVLFGATFAVDGIEVVSDILVRHKDGAIDLYEVKSGTKVKQRYLTDLALQVIALEAAGHTLRSTFLLHQNPRYEHKEGADYPPMQLLKSAEVTPRVRKQVPHLRARLDDLKKACTDEAVLELPMGTWCREPLACPRFATCRKQAPARPVFELQELSRELEKELRREGITELPAIDPQRPGLTFAQRRQIEAVREGRLIVEPFVREELAQAHHPIHFVAVATALEAMPRFDGQRPWRRIPYAWALQTLHADGRVTAASFTHAERTDPRLPFITTLGKQLEIGGTVIGWDTGPIESLRSLLEDLPAAKIAVRAVIARSTFDLMQLFRAGIFHPELRDHTDLVATARALLDDAAGDPGEVRGEDALRETLEKAWAPRIRATTREKITAAITQSLTWDCEQMLALYRKFSGFAAQIPTPTPKPARGPAKALPKLPGS